MEYYENNYIALLSENIHPNIEFEIQYIYHNFIKIIEPHNVTSVAKYKKNSKIYFENLNVQDISFENSKMPLLQ